MSQWRLAAQVAGLSALLAFVPTQAQGRNYGRGNQYAAARQRMVASAQAQIAAARQAQAAAQLQMNEAKTKINASNDRIRAAKSSLDSAKSDEHTSHLSLQDIQAKLIEETGPDSAISKSHGALVDALADYEQAAKRVLHSDEYKAKADAITDHSERLKRLPEIREAAFEADEDYLNKLARVKIEKAKFAQLRTEMVRGSSEWMAMSESLRESLKEQNHAEIEARNGGFSKVKAKYRLHDAEQVHAAASLSIAQAENVLRRLGVKPPPPPASPPTSASGS